MNKKNETSKLTFMGVMLALTIVFILTSMVPNPASANIAVLLFLPTILTAVIYGFKSGAIMGLCAGTASLLRALLMPNSPLDPFFINPLVSVIPRICIGLVVAFVFALLHRKLKVNRIVSSSIAAGFGMFTNTLLVIGSLYLLYGQGVTGILGAGFVVALGAIFLSNGLLELAVAAIIIPIIYSAYSRYNKIK